MEGYGVGFIVASCKLQVAGYPPSLKLRRTGRFQVTGYRLQVAGSYLRWLIAISQS